jgi:hypothetical protein
MTAPASRAPYVVLTGQSCVVAAIVRLVLLKESLAQIDANYSLVCKSFPRK